jgi:excisionase family DNA binding protein
MLDLVTVDEAAEELHVHRNTIYNHIKRGKLAAWKNHQGWKIARPSVLALRDSFFNNRLEQIAVTIRAVTGALNTFATPMSLTRVTQLDDHLCLAYRLIECNEALKNLTGLPVSELRSIECFHRFTHPDDLEHLPSFQHEEMKPGMRWEVEFRWRLPPSPSNMNYSWVRAKGLLMNPSKHSNALISINEFHPIND